MNELSRAHAAAIDSARASSMGLSFFKVNWLLRVWNRSAQRWLA
jgi:hypothetical protein